MDKKGKKFKIFLIFVLSFVLPFFIMSDVKAEESNNKKDTYCLLCTHVDEEDPLYKKERQFYQKIKIIKSVFGDSIDEVALAASVLHRYSGADVTYEREYESDFNEDSYRSTWQDILNIKLFESQFALTDDEKKQVEANDKISLLTTAAIVMIDSNHGGTYSDVCFKEALAGDQLVNNDGQSGVFGDLVNGFVCHVYQGINISTPFQYISNAFNGDNFLVTATSAKNRVVNTKRICENGFVGGLYSNVRKVKDSSKQKKLKKLYAQQIIDLSNYYKRLYGSGVSEVNKCTVNISGSTGDFANWRQGDSKWGSISLGGVSSVSRAGCLVTSISMQIARSGTKIGALPSGYLEFNPGAFVTSLNENGGFAEKGNYAWTGYQTIAPNWGIGNFVSLKVNKNKELASVISKELSTGYGSENYQKFLVIQMHHSGSSQHWVAVNGVQDDVVTIYDPGKGATTFDEKYKNWVVDGYRIMYAKDVPFGQTGTTANNTCASKNSDSSLDSSTSNNGTGVGKIKIPEQYGKGGYTVTTIDTINWAPGTGQGKLADEWKRKGSQYNKGIAVIDGRYLIACTTTFGKVGDKIDFYLDDGTKIPTIMMDEKSQEYVAWDHNPANKWGHDNGANVLEFEVSNSFYRKYGNPGNGYNDWYKEWAGKRVASATNLGSGDVDSESEVGAESCVNGQAISPIGFSGESSELAYRRIRDVKSSTGILIAVDYDRSYVHVFAGSAGDWKLVRSFPAVTGRNRYFGYEVDRNGVNTTPIGLTRTSGGVDVVSTQHPQYTLTYTVRINSNAKGGASWFHGLVRGYISKSTNPDTQHDLMPKFIRNNDKRASGGCVMLVNEDAKWLFNTVKNGTTCYIWTEKPATNKDGFENKKLKTVMVSKGYSDVSQLKPEDRLYVYGSSGPLPYPVVNY